MALKKLKVPHEHVFSCDIDKNVKTQILHNFPPKVWFDDLMERDNNSSATPAADLYVAGFPCQPFSQAGLQKGFKDRRGMVFYGCADYIDSKRPRAFILENVKRLIGHDNGNTFKQVLHSLEGLGDGAYNVTWKLLNSQEHGVPQSRPRVYIIGIRKDCQRSEFSFPEPRNLVSIERFLDPVKRKPTLADLPGPGNVTVLKNVKDTLHRKIRSGEDPFKNTYVVDVDSTPRFCGVMYDRTMCMTKSRPLGFWVTSRGRRMNKDEMLRCQGMERSFEQVVRDSALGAQIGNAMSQNIIERLLCRLLPAAGLVQPTQRLYDRWAAATSKGETRPKPLRRAPAKKRRAPTTTTPSRAKKVARKA